MDARPNTNPADQAEGQHPVTERPMGRRTMLRAMILTVPVVAAFSRNAYAATDGHGCQLPTYLWCSICQRCLFVGDIGSRHCDCSSNSGNHGCNNPECNQPETLRAAVVGGGGSLTSPFNANSAAINDGGFNASPWR